MKNKKSKFKRIILLSISVIMITSLGLGAFSIFNKNNINTLIPNSLASEEEQNEIIAEIGNMSINGDSTSELADYIDKNIKKLNTDNASLSVVYLYYSALGNTEKSRKIMASCEDEFLEIANSGIDIKSKEFEKSIKTDLGKEAYKQIKENYNRMIYTGSFITIDVNNDYIVEKYGEYIKQDLRDNMKFLSGVYFKYPNSDEEIITSVGESIYNIEEMIKRNIDSAFIVTWTSSLKELKNYYFLVSLTDDFIDENKKVKDIHIEGYKKNIEKYKDSEIAKETEEFLKVLEENKWIIDDKIVETNTKNVEEAIKKYTKNTTGTGDMFEQIQSQINESLDEKLK